MSGITRFSEAASIAMHAMVLLAAARDRHVTVRELAARLPVSESHLAKVLQRLVRARLVDSVRGPGGGFLLRGDPAAVTLLEVYEAIEGALELRCCLLSPARSCRRCILGGALREVNAIVRAKLARTCLADAAPFFHAPASRRSARGRIAAPARRRRGRIHRVPTEIKR